MSRNARAWQYDAFPGWTTMVKPGYSLVPYRPNTVLQRLRSCPASLDTASHLQLVFKERFSASQVSSPRETLLIDEVSEAPKNILDAMRTSQNTWNQGRITLALAETAGSCQGVHQALQSAYVAIEETGGRLHLTSEVLHAGVAEDFHENFCFIPRGPDGRDYSQVQAGDVVLLPVFGSTAQEMDVIHQKGAGVITTVCSLISGQPTSMGSCAVIHGSRQDHQVEPTGNYIFVKDLEEAQYLGIYILCGGDDIEFARKFQGAISDGFDANSMLHTIVFHCQTRCMHAKKETGEIGDLLRTAMIEKFGIDRMDDHFISFDDSWDMEWDLLKAGKGENRKLDIVIVVGAFKSRRAKRLQHIAKIAKIQTYWIDSPSCINVERNAITWQDSRRRIGSTFGFLPHGETLVGIMPDSSISNRTLEEVMQKLYEIQNRDI